MKTLVTFTVISVSVLLMGLNISSNKVSSKPEVPISVETEKKIYLQPPKQAPTCPSSEYNVALLNRITNDNTGFPVTEHCARCNMGALYPHGESKKCTYCEAIF